MKYDNAYEDRDRNGVTFGSIIPRGIFPIHITLLINNNNNNNFIY